MPGSLSRTPYYSSSSTVANTGAIVAGLNRPGSSQLLSPYGAARPDQRITSANPLDSAGTGQGALLSVSSRLVRIDNGQSLTGPLNQRLLGSRLFGAVREVSLDALADQARQGNGGALYSQPGSSLTRSLDDARRESAQRAEQQRAAAQSGQNWSGSDQPSNRDYGDTGAGRLATPPKEGSLASAGDVYDQMRRKSGTLARTLSSGIEPPTVAGRDTDKNRLQASGTPPAELSHEDTFGPMRTFVGSQASVMNARLAEAEALLKQGQYYRAAETYAAAQSADPTNPLPHLGRSVSLLAAGDYMTSANALFTSVRLFDSLGQFQIDLKSLVADAGVLESRRADLEKRLQLFDDFRLRFLLGYLQFSTGLPDAGLANLEAAAKKAPAEFESVGRFVADLRAKHNAPPAPATQPAGG
jgi:tetratricopeptide (TPR) repeat protein